MVLPRVSIARKWEVFGFSLLSKNHGVFDNSTSGDVAVFVEPSDLPLFFRPLFPYCFDVPIQELLQHSTIPTPRNTVLNFALSSTNLPNTNRTRVLFSSSRVEQNRTWVSMFEILLNTNQTRVLFSSVQCGAELEQTEHVLKNVLFCLFG